MRAFIKVIALVLCIAVTLPMCIFAQAQGELKLITPPSRVDFYEGRDWGYVRGQIFPYANFDLSGTVLEYENELIPFYIFPWGANMWCEPVSGKWKAGPNDIDILSDDIDGVSVRSSINLHPISGITVVEPPSDTEYIRGIDWNYNQNGDIEVSSVKLEGLKLKVVYSDRTSDIIAYNKKTGTVSWEVLDDNFRFRLGENEIYASFCNRTAMFRINIQLESITSAYVKTQPQKRSYSFGTDWKYIRGKVTPAISLDGLVVGANCNNGETKYISYSEEPERFSIVENQSFQTGYNSVKILLDSQFEMNVSFALDCYGDVDLDGSVNSTDALLILKHVVGTAALGSNEQRYADVNGDGRITSADALDILRKSVGLIGLFESEI